jgi:AbrB family looped-hinge helix DNA binding protein
MEVTIDQRGRILIPKVFRDRLGLSAGTVVNVSPYDDGVCVARSGRTAQLRLRNGRVVATSETQITDKDVTSLVDSVRL